MEEHYLSTKNEIKFAVEAMTQCGANCVGCFLTPELRLAQDFWNLTRFNEAKEFIRSSIQHLEKQGKNIDEIAINMGQGDYFQLNENEIRQVIDFIYDCAEGKASAFITASGITNYQKLKKAVDYFYQYSIEKEQALLIDFVLDASRLSSPKMFKIYSENLSYIRFKFGHVDVNLNINADTVKNSTPESINKFMIDNELKFLVINVVPAFHNQEPLQNSWNKIVDWMYQLYDLWDKSSYELNFANGIKTLLLAYPSENNLFSVVKGGIQEVMLKEYVIDNKGHIFFQQAGFGDLPLSDRNGFKKIADISHAFNYEFLEKESQKVCIQIIKEQTKNVCNTCSFKNICAANGMFVTNKILHSKDSKYSAPAPDICPINIKPLYEAINSQSKHTLREQHQFAGVYTQQGLKHKELKTESMNYSDKEIKFN